MLTHRTISVHPHKVLGVLGSTAWHHASATGSNLPILSTLAAHTAIVTALSADDTGTGTGAWMHCNLPPN